MPYHVYPYADEFAEEWDAVFAYAEAHPEMVTEEQPYASPVFMLEEAKARKLREINSAADRVISELTATYPDRGISTFDKQESEARAYTADPTSPTQLLSALAGARGITLDDLVKADAFAVASGHIIGKRQELEDRLHACATIEELQSINVVVDLSGQYEQRKGNIHSCRPAHQYVSWRLARRNTVVTLLPLVVKRRERLAS